MKHIINALLIICVSLIYCDAYAFKINLKKGNTAYTDLTTWVAAQSFPEDVEGVKQYYPISVGVAQEDTEEIDTVAVVRGFVPVSGMTAPKIMLAGMVYVSSHFQSDAKEGFEAIEYAENRFTVILKSTQGSNSNETTYTRSLTVTARDNGFDFETFNIDCRFREKGLIPRTLRMEKLHPDQNKRHLGLLTEFVGINSEYIAGLSEYIASRTDIAANIDRLRKCAGEVTPGMNQDEVIILLGAPRDKRKSGEKERWIYDYNYVVIFDGGIVVKIVR